MQKLLLALAAALLIVGCESQAQTNQSKTLQEIDDFSLVASEASNKNIPILIMFTAEDCGFCKQLKREVINPMLKGGLYDGYAMLMRQISVDSKVELLLPDGESVKKFRYARSHRAFATPTLIFVDAHGRQIGDPIIGTADTQLYAAMIHKSVNQGLTKLGNPMKLPVVPEAMTRPLPGFPEK